MNTIKQALENNPLMAAITIFVFGVSCTLAVLGILVPELWSIVAQALTIIAMCLGVVYFILNRRYDQSADFFAGIHAVRIEIVWMKPQRQTVMAMA